MSFRVPFWAVLEPSWALWRASWGHVGPSWGDPGGLWGSLGRCEPPNVVYARNARFPKEMKRCLLVGTLLEGLLRLSWSFSAASRAVWGPAWASWSNLSATRGRLDGRILGARWAILGRSWGTLGQSWTL
eukprot:3700369-Pyramimonas_sp.AAC.1